MSFVIASRSARSSLGLIAGLILLMPAHAHAEWWKRTPSDFEECADRAERYATKQEKTAALAECNAKFAGRRKIGGGYSYYDVLQDRSFDIAGPNPTSEEQKKIDESYAAYLANQRRANLAAEAAAKQQQQQQQEQVQQVALRTETARVPVPVERPKQPRPKACTKDSFSCEWPRLSESLNELKKLFSPTPSKAKKG
ncbi:hypothetical protein NLM33_28000 [Bradyrhizobium sp. CCGUVB1N3]|uniref:hypothetical protein n=1 Tax=Bradyrhizobium sp. CCGUVB1N3 TaxID=2949629 RepID=UPI0020B3231E|nr:hypothetical protein [Bradyrhizobium sp. CCGUVB1N3]MCP3474162.1 hypothetical protein [Bradyrhizobium sp. CCGUVB1N3]